MLKLPALLTQNFGTSDLPRSIRMESLARHGVFEGIEVLTADESSHSCAWCIYGTVHKAPIPKKSSSRSSAQLELIHCDVLGPVDVPSLGGSRYFITFIDDFLKWTTIFTMPRKSDGSESFRKFQKYAETHTGNKLPCLHILKYTSDRNSLKLLRTYDGGE